MAFVRRRWAVVFAVLVAGVALAAIGGASSEDDADDPDLSAAVPPAPAPVAPRGPMYTAVAAGIGWTPSMLAVDAERSELPSQDCLVAEFYERAAWIPFTRYGFSGDPEDSTTSIGGWSVHHAELHFDTFMDVWSICIADMITEVFVGDLTGIGFAQSDAECLAAEMAADDDARLLATFGVREGTLRDAYGDAFVDGIVAGMRRVQEAGKCNDDGLEFVIAALERPRTEPPTTRYNRVVDPEFGSTEISEALIANGLLKEERDCIGSGLRSQGPGPDLDLWEWGVTEDGASPDALHLWLEVRPLHRAAFDHVVETWVGCTADRSTAALAARLVSTGTAGEGEADCLAEQLVADPAARVAALYGIPLEDNPYSRAVSGIVEPAISELLASGTCA